MNFIQKCVESYKSRNKMYIAITREVLPIFHDKYMSTNKEVIELDLDDERVTKLPLETQDGVPVIFHKNFKESIYDKNYGKHEGNLDFTIGGMKAGDIIEIKDGGFLENITDIYEVILLTDRFVYLKNISKGWFVIKSHEEIERIKYMDGIA